jgi:transcriptional regulator with XRE-family HTH domain
MSTKRIDTIIELKNSILKDFYNLMEKNRWSITEAAQQIGCCRSHLSKIIADTRSPSLELLKIIEEVVNSEK